MAKGKYVDIRARPRDKRINELLSTLMLEVQAKKINSCGILGIFHEGEGGIPLRYNNTSS